MATSKTFSRIGPHLNFQFVTSTEFASIHLMNISMKSRQRALEIDIPPAGRKSELIAQLKAPSRGTLKMLRRILEPLLTSKFDGLENLSRRRPDDSINSIYKTMVYNSPERAESMGFKQITSLRDGVAASIHLKGNMPANDTPWVQHNFGRYR